ncbi:acylneuraminate cytidylyltransferase family protein [Alcaligenes nematophilus]|uniref:acylneuraminate cytidylyltransferase family protein n=1 Tax=Alcaligenes nematophilus TaxID=2994643 RepID=UPI0035B524CB
MKTEQKRWTAIVPARAGSKGLPGKNVKLLGGIELYQHAVLCARQAGAEHILVSTDISQILAGTHDFTVHARAAHLADDQTPMKDVVLELLAAHSIRGTVVLLQPTSPLRTPDAVRQALALHEAGAYELTLSVSEADRSVLKYGQIQDGRFVPLQKPEYCFRNRQHLPAVYRPNGAIYVFDAQWFLEQGDFVSTKMGAFLMPLEESIDIDVQADLLACEQILDARKRALDP